jgi:hypothetical protein
MLDVVSKQINESKKELKEKKDSKKE